MASRSRACLLACALLAAACADESPGATDPSPGADERVHLVVDTDMAFDDVRALMMLAMRPDVELLAVTVSGNGIARCPAGAANAKAILDALDRPSVPVACGPRAPIEGFNLAPTAWRDSADALAGMELSEATGFDDGGAPQLVVDAISGAARPVTVLTLGPLTNLATAIELDPTIMDDVERLVVMGGAFDVGGNTLSFTTPPVAEFNIWFDPVAAQRVFATEVDLTLVPLDATNHVPVTPVLYEALAATGDDARPATQLLGGYMAANPFFGGTYHWDDLAAAAVIDPGLVTTEERTIRVVTDPGPDIGRTVDDPGGRPAAVGVTADRAGFERFFADVFGLAGLDSSDFTPDARVVYDGSTCGYEGPDPLPAELLVEVTNTSATTVLGVIAAVYDPGTTAEDLAAYEASNPTGPPSFLTLTGIAPLPAATTSYWRFENPPDTTLSCIFDLGSGAELAGPRVAGAG